MSSTDMTEMPSFHGEPSKFVPLGKSKSSTSLHLWRGVPNGQSSDPITFFSAVGKDSLIIAPLCWKYVDDLTLGEIVALNLMGLIFKKILISLDGAW